MCASEGKTLTPSHIFIATCRSVTSHSQRSSIHLGPRARNSSRTYATHWWVDTGVLSLPRLCRSWKQEVRVIHLFLWEKWAWSPVRTKYVTLHQGKNILFFHQPRCLLNILKIKQFAANKLWNLSTLLKIYLCCSNTLSQHLQPVYESRKMSRNIKTTPVSAVIWPVGIIGQATAPA